MTPVGSDGQPATAAAKDRPVGRRPGDPDDTREDILRAARDRFGAVGFERATIRSIAEGADVDPALIIHHFGSKQGLFAAAHELPFDPKVLIDQVIALPADQRARALSHAFLSNVLGSGSPAGSLMRAAATNEAAALMMREFVSDVFLSRADRLAPGPDATLRVALAGSHLVGLVFARMIIGIEPLTEAAIDELAERVAPAVDHHLRGNVSPPQL